MNSVNYFGLFVDESDSSLHYGWGAIFLGPTFNANTRTLEAVYYESQPNVAITITGTGPVVVPEPATTALIAAGAAGLLAWRRRKLQ